MDISLTVSPEMVVLVTFFCVGSVKFIDSLAKREWVDAAKIAGSTLVGAVVALLIPDFTVLTGAAVGLNASGLVTSLGFVAKKASVKATATVTPPAPVDGEVVA
jgi:hypothetical protein